MTQILAEDVARCAPAAAAKKLERYFAQFPHEGTAIRYEIEAPFEALNLPPIAKFSREVTLTLSEPKARNSDTLVPLTWVPLDGGMLPSFTGYIEITPMASDELQLALVGEYKPPLGPIGGAFDAVLGHRIADVTVEHFVAELKRAIEAPEQ